MIRKESTHDLGSERFIDGMQILMYDSQKGSAQNRRVD